YSLRYGTIPIVRATGGLEDTVTDEAAGRGATVYTFQEYTPAALVRTVARAVEVFRKPKRWQALQQAAMAQDHGWDVSGREYVKEIRGDYTRKGCERIRKIT